MKAPRDSRGLVLLCLLACGLLCGCDLVLGEPGTVHATVLGAGGFPEPYAEVRVLRRGREKAAATCDGKGEAELQVRRGLYELRASSQDGRRTSRGTEIRVRPSETSRVILQVR